MSATIQNKAIYQHIGDTRQNIYAFTGKNSLQIQRQAASVVGFMNKAYLIKDPVTASYALNSHIIRTLNEWVNEVYGCPLGEDESFGSEPTPVSGSGFLVGADTVLTAAHMVCNAEGKVDPKKINNRYVVFDFKMHDVKHPKTQFGNNEVYEIKKVKTFASALEDKQWSDWALVKLDRKVGGGRKPLTLDSACIPKDLQLYMLGHPNGMPLKYTGPATVVDTSSKRYFECNLDAFGGNSGSPVFRMDTDKVVGILCQGHKDYLCDEDHKGTGQKRMVPNRINPDTAESHERCERISKLKEVQRYLTQRDSGFKLQKIPAPKDLQAPGLYVLGKCSSMNCSNFNSLKWIALGTGTFHLEKVMHLTVCGKCPTWLTVSDVAVYKTKYHLNGELIEPKSAEIEKEGQASTHLKSVLQKDTTWGYLKMTIGETPSTSSLFSFPWIKIL